MPRDCGGNYARRLSVEAMPYPGELVRECPSWVKTGKAQCEHMISALPPKDGVIGRPSLWIAEDCWVLRFRLMVKRGPWLRPQASEGEAQHEPFCRIGRIGQGDQHLHCG